LEDKRTDDEPSIARRRNWGIQIVFRLLGGAVGGLAYWLAMVMPAVPLTGLGGGPPTWPAPFVVSLPGFLLLPATGILLSIPGDACVTARIRKAWAARVLLWLIIGLDAVLAADTGGLLHDLRSYGSMFLGFVLLFGIPWLAMWAFWHFVLIRITMGRT
jgi:hypothetical protein